MLAYSDPINSPLGKYFKPAERARAADALNDAVLAHLHGGHKESSLTRLMQHLEVTNDALRQAADNKGPRFRFSSALP